MPRQQHLFALTHWLVKAATWLSILLSTVLVLALAGVVVAAMNLDGNHLGIPAEIEGVARGAALEIAAAAVVAGLCCVVLVVFTFRAIEGIVDTAISGDPFVNENADRLARVGWLLLALSGVGFVAGGVIKLMVEHLVPANLHHHVDFGFGTSPSELLVVLLVFVLAQIFRRGSEMRAELEGTV